MGGIYLTSNEDFILKVDVLKAEKKMFKQKDFEEDQVVCKLESSKLQLLLGCFQSANVKKVDKYINMEHKSGIWRLVNNMLSGKHFRQVVWVLVCHFPGEHFAPGPIMGRMWVTEAVGCFGESAAVGSCYPL